MTTQDKPEALRLAEALEDAVQTYPQYSEEESGGYLTEQDQLMALAVDVLRRQHAEIQRLREEAKRHELRPIETAPGFGEEFLAFKPGVGFFCARILDTDHPDCEYDGGVHCAWDHAYVGGVTHWVPLPSSPLDAAMTKKLEQT